MATITDQIIQSLAAESDFGFEMRVGQELRSLPPESFRQHESYHDPKNPKGPTDRTFDFQVIYAFEHWRLQMAVECKNIHEDAPYVVCGHKRRVEESLHDVICTGYNMARSPTARIARVKPHSELYPVLDVGGKDSFVGKSVFRPKPPEKPKPTEALQGFTVLRDDGYDRWNQALASAAFMSSRAPWHPGPAGSNPILALVLPVYVVPDSALWRLEFDGDGGVVGAPSKTDHVTLFVDRHVDTRDFNPHRLQHLKITLSHVHFFTLGGLRHWLRSVVGSGHRFWRGAMPDDLKQGHEHWPSV
jgi:hypothetical protein